MPDFPAIAKQLDHRPAGDPTPVGGGCIHRAYRWGDLFLKLNDRDQLPNFEAEANGLAALRATGSIRVPAVRGLGGTTDHAFLALEWLDLTPSGDETLLGEQLAALHAHRDDRYGFPADNFLGATPQPNGWLDSWPEFFRQRRLGHLLEQLAARGVTFPGAERLLERLDDLLPAHPPGSLLHGDLWGGNRAFLADGTPVLFDPACHHGDAACDLAMARLFGGFGERFFEAYRLHAAPGADDPQRIPLYQLYHVLNHALLFGGGYVEDAAARIRRLA